MTGTGCSMVRNGTVPRYDAALLAVDRANRLDGDARGRLLSGTLDQLRAVLRDHPDDVRAPWVLMLAQVVAEPDPDGELLAALVIATKTATDAWAVLQRAAAEPE